MTLAIIIAVLIMLLFQCFFEVAYVNGKSMEPTFQNGDALLLKKWGVPKKDDIIIKNYKAVNKSYPSFFKTFEKLGGKIEYLGA